MPWIRTGRGSAFGNTQMRVSVRTANGTEAMIDWDRIEELRKDIGGEDFPEVVDLFLEEVGEAMARLKHATTPAEHEAELHLMKGSALNLGFTAFAALCAAGEESGSSDTAALQRMFDASRDALLAGLRRGIPTGSRLR